MHHCAVVKRQVLLSLCHFVSFGGSINVVGTQNYLSKLVKHISLLRIFTVCPKIGKQNRWLSQSDWGMLQVCTNWCAVYVYNTASIATGFAQLALRYPTAGRIWEKMISPISTQLSSNAQRTANFASLFSRKCRSRHHFQVRPRLRERVPLTTSTTCGNRLFSGEFGYGMQMMQEAAHDEEERARIPRMCWGLEDWRYYRDIRWSVQVGQNHLWIFVALILCMRQYLLILLILLIGWFNQFPKCWWILL